MSIRVGIGFDVHRLVAGEGFRLGGVDVACAFRTLAHSDGDVLLHALADAMLGAAALGDLGEHFPDTDPRWEDADSRGILGAVHQLVSDAGFAVANVDANVFLERPKLGRLKDAMRACIAGVLDVDVTCVGVKARTAETLGPVGASEAVAAQAVVLLTRTEETS